MGRKATKQNRKTKTMKVIHQKSSIEEIVQIYNFLGGIIGFWVLLYPNPFKLVITMSITVALIGFAIMFIFNKSVEFFTKDKSQPFVGGAILLNSAAVWGIGIFNSNTMYSSAFWKCFIICISIFIVLIFVTKRNNLKNIPYLILFLMAISAYSMGAIININYLYDNSKPTIYGTSIAKKDIYESGVKYHVKLHEVWVFPWGQCEEKTRVIVSEEFYDSVNDDQKVQLCLKSGLLGVRWYYLQI